MPPLVRALRRALPLVLVLLGACRPDAPADAPLVDDLGRTLALEGPAARVVTLAPGLADLVTLAAGADRLAGVSQADSLPSGLETLPRLPSHPPDVQRLVALAPDLVLAAEQANRPEAVGRLAEFGIPSYFFSLRTLDDVPRALRTLDRLLGAAGGAPAAAQFELRQAEVARIVAGAERPRVLLLAGTGDALRAFGRDAYQSDLVRAAGGLNLTDAFEGLEVRLSEAFALEQAPDVIVVLAPEGYDRRRLTDAHPAWLDTPAVREGRVYALAPDLVARPGPRLAEALERLARLLHPGLFAAGAA
ncbi:MAG: ABC transporter substrate-binding protein [Rubricoccaceae bacterium]